MGLFRRKKKEKRKMDLSGYDMVLSVKAICMYEKLSGKSFFNFAEEDIAMLLYCSFYTTNNTEIKYETFLNMLEIDDLTSWAIEKYKNILEVIRQFKQKDTGEEKPDTQEDADIKDLTMTDMATSLIVDYGIDAHYVMNEMRLWEIEPLYKACDAMVKRKYEEKRLWTYIDIMPHIDGKKIKGPTDILPFPWEESKKEKAKTELGKNSAAAFSFLTRQAEKGESDGDR